MGIRLGLMFEVRLAPGMRIGIGIRMGVGMRDRNNDGNGNTIRDGDGMGDGGKRIGRGIKIGIHKGWEMEIMRWE